MKEFDRLSEIIAALRGEKGCDWDKKQTFLSMRKYVLEEVYELFEALEKEDREEIKEELGDILMHAVFFARMAEEKGWFSLPEILNTINEKLIVRHPHVFGDEKVSGVSDILKNWEALKKKEKKERVYTLDGIPAALPALNQAVKIQEKLSRVGFDWADEKGVLDKLEEELSEMRQEISSGHQERLESELGDVLFVLVNLALRKGIDPDAALRKTNAKVIARFSGAERLMKAEGKGLESLSVDEMEAYWQRAKKLEF